VLLKTVRQRAARFNAFTAAGAASGTKPLNCLSKRRRRMKSKHSIKEDSGLGAPRRVFIVEDHPVFREGLVQIINGQEDLIICGQCEDAEKALQDIPRLKPELVLVDITLPGKSGLELIKDVRTQDGKVKLLVLSMDDEALYADRVLRAGGDGYVMRQEDPEEIVQAIRDVLGGHIYVSEEVMVGRPKAAPKRGSEPKTRLLSQLLDTELEVLQLLGQGKTHSEIARSLQLSVVAVTAYYTQIKRKLNLESANALTRQRHLRLAPAGEIL
jgi:DNA-binding NarL/FixJ family response regulator